MSVIREDDDAVGKLRADAFDALHAGPGTLFFRRVEQPVVMFVGRPDEP